MRCVSHVQVGDACVARVYCMLCVSVIGVFVVCVTLRYTVRMCVCIFKNDICLLLFCVCVCWEGVVRLCFICASVLSIVCAFSLRI